MSSEYSNAISNIELILRLMSTALLAETIAETAMLSDFCRFADLPNLPLPPLAFHLLMYLRHLTDVVACALLTICRSVYARTFGNRHLQHALLIEKFRTHIDAMLVWIVDFFRYHPHPFALQARPSYPPLLGTPTPLSQVLQPPSPRYSNPPLLGTPTPLS